MCTSRSEHWLAGAALALAGLSGCDIEPSEPRFGIQLTDLEFNLYSEDMGIYPSDDVLADPANPFRETGVGDDAKFEILEAGGNVATFYAWATLLAVAPNGENQYYTAVALEGMTETGEVPDSEISIVRDMARRAYTAVLVYFPNSVTFAANEIQFFRLATPAYQGIVRLGGIPPAGWVLVETPDGGQEAVWASGGLGNGGGS